MGKAKAWLLDNLLWIIAMGLMLASSGIDGMYMARWMPPRVPWLGLVLNTMADTATVALTYSYGRLQQSPSRKKQRASWVLLGAEGVAVLYSWFFSWRQLSKVLPAVEGAATIWVAPVAAGFIPLLLAFCGYAESLSKAKLADSQNEARKPSYTCPLCQQAFGSQAGLNAHKRRHAGSPASKSRGPADG